MHLGGSAALYNGTAKECTCKCSLHDGSHQKTSKYHAVKCETDRRRMREHSDEEVGIIRTVKPF